MSVPDSFRVGTTGAGVGVLVGMAVGVAVVVSTVMLAEPPAPAVSFELTSALLFFTPAVVPVMLTLKVHLSLAASVAPDTVIVVEPAVAVIVPPPHDPVNPLGVATTRPAGRESSKDTPVSPMVPFVLMTVKVKLVVLSSGIVEAPNALMASTGVITVILADAVLPVPPFEEVTVTLFTFTPPENRSNTLTLKVHLSPPASVAPDRVIVVEPSVAVIVPPPHDPVNPLGVDTTMVVGSESVNPTPVSEAMVLGFVMLKVRLVGTRSGTVAAPNALEIVGGAT